MQRSVVAVVQISRQAPQKDSTQHNNTQPVLQLVAQGNTSLIGKDKEVQFEIIQQRNTSLTDKDIDLQQLHIQVSTSQGNLLQDGKKVTDLGGGKLGKLGDVITFTISPDPGSTSVSINLSLNYQGKQMDSKTVSWKTSHTSFYGFLVGKFSEKRYGNM